MGKGQKLRVCQYLGATHHLHRRNHVHDEPGQLQMIKSWRGPALRGLHVELGLDPLGGLEGGGQVVKQPLHAHGEPLEDPGYGKVISLQSLEEENVVPVQPGNEVVEVNGGDKCLRRRVVRVRVLVLHLQGRQAGVRREPRSLGLDHVNHLISSLRGGEPLFLHGTGHVGGVHVLLLGGGRLGLLPSHSQLGEHRVLYLNLSGAHARAVHGPTQTAVHHASCEVAVRVRDDGLDGVVGTALHPSSRGLKGGKVS